MSRLALVGLVLASALVGGAASSYVAVAIAQSQPPAPARAVRFEHMCATMDGMAMKTAGERGWEMVAAYTSLGGSKLVLKGSTGPFSQYDTKLPVTPTTYCFKRALP
jgi:hypothetical protein